MQRTEQRYVVIGEHFYQPPRKAHHSRVATVPTDPSNIDWNRRIAQECYIPQTQRGTLSHVSFDFYATIRQEMGFIAPEEKVRLKEAMHERGVGDPFLHVLLPDIDRRDKSILISAGQTAFQQEAGFAPRWLWLPETALDRETLDVAKEFGYEGVLCAPEQIEANQEVDSRPVRVSTAHGSILTLPFDRPFSQSLAFDNKSNADQYARDVIIPRLLRLPKSKPLIGWTDGETFGHHAKFADLFLHHLVTTSLPEAGIGMLGLNDIAEVWSEDDYVEGRLRERTAWSCPHGNLIRWHGACSCDGYEDGSWKTSFYDALQKLNRTVSQILDTELGSEWAATLAESFTDAFHYEGGSNTELSLYAAKASSLASQTSCGTFFKNPGTSGRINMVFARQTLEHLRDAQYGRVADQMQLELNAALARSTDPFSGSRLDEYFADTLAS